MVLENKSRQASFREGNNKAKQPSNLSLNLGSYDGGRNLPLADTIRAHVTSKESEQEAWKEEGKKKKELPFYSRLTWMNKTE